MEKKKKQTPQAYNQTYYQEKALAMNSGIGVSQLIEAGVYGVIDEDAAVKMDKLVENTIEFYNQNIEPFVKPIDAKAANEALKILQDARK